MSFNEHAGNPFYYSPEYIAGCIKLTNEILLELGLEKGVDFYYDKYVNNKLSKKYKEKMRGHWRKVLNITTPDRKGRGKEAEEWMSAPYNPYSLGNMAKEEKKCSNCKYGILGRYGGECSVEGEKVGLCGECFADTI